MNDVQKKDLIKAGLILISLVVSCDRYCYGYGLMI
jgi:hypothetical protein